MANQFVHVESHTQDPEKAKKFYKELFEGLPANEYCGSDFCPEGLHIIAKSQKSATLGLRRQQEPVLTLGCIADPLLFEYPV